MWVRQMYLREEDFLCDYFGTVEAVLPHLGGWRPNYACNDRLREARRLALVHGTLAELTPTQGVRCPKCKGIIFPEGHGGIVANGQAKSVSEPEIVAELVSDREVELEARLRRLNELELEMEAERRRRRRERAEEEEWAEERRRRRHASTVSGYMVWAALLLLAMLLSWPLWSASWQRSFAFPVGFFGSLTSLGIGSGIGLVSCFRRPNRAVFLATCLASASVGGMLFWFFAQASVSE